MKVYRIWSVKRKAYAENSKRSWWGNLAAAKKALGHFNNDYFARYQGYTYVIHEFDLSEPKEIA